ncbi:hypothetical protein P879_03905 [Paragonimus westermani]|uniref:Uncharacterized protein n=1 Tax=Paragonimus westermani TaxID=34504 RepID=A0A8T0DTY6_9TREM|nr:hypothetical protein P879_03905 [Paragonimus westermani]
MDLLERYVGHRGEVVCITFRPNPITQPHLGQAGEWISGSDDCTIRVWSANCDGLCRLTLHTGGPVTCFVWEAARGVLIAGVDKDINASADGQLRIWRAWTGNTDAVANKQQANKSDENTLEPMDSMNEALHRAELAASKLSSNPAAAIGAAARAYSAVNRIHSTV